MSNPGSELNERIARFENMTAADPTNEMAHFSLGSAYQQADRHAEAATSFERCLELNPEMSKAYQLAGQSMIEAGWADRAVEILNRGYEVAARKGDQMPRQAMADLLESIGRTPPKLDDDVEEQAATTGKFICQRTGRPGTQLTDPPLRGPIGRWIQENIAAETWQEWIAQGTKVINELKLDFSREEDQDTYDTYMYEYLGIDEVLLKELRDKAAASA